MQLAKHTFSKTPYHRGHIVLWFFLLGFITAALFHTFLGLFLILSNLTSLSAEICFTFTIGITSIITGSKAYHYGIAKWFFNEIEKGAEFSNTFVEDLSVNTLLQTIEAEGSTPAERQEARHKLANLLAEQSIDTSLRKQIRTRHP
jgi:hypothetical protein